MADDNKHETGLNRGYLIAALVMSVVAWNVGSMLYEKPSPPNIVKAWPSMKLDTTVGHNESQDDRYITALRKAAMP